MLSLRDLEIMKNPSMPNGGSQRENGTLEILICECNLKPMWTKKVLRKTILVHLL